MGLPTKKQMQKHRRGTRKALNTLDALVDAEKQPEALVTDTPAAKSAKKTAKTPPKATAAKKKPAAVVEPKVEEPKSIPKKKESEKTEKIVETAVEKSDVQAKQQPGFQKDKMAASRSESDVETVAGQMESDDEDEDTQKDRFLSFRIRQEDYAIEIRFVTEIIVMHKITEVPDTSPCIKGVINLRGKVIPVMDVRERFKLEKRDYDDRTCIIVVDVNEVTVGLIVDTVNEVVDIPEDQIDAPPATHSGIESNYINGMGKVGNKVKILLDVENVLILK